METFIISRIEIIKVKTVVALLTFFFCPSVAIYASDQPHSYRPPNGYVSDEATALKIAEVILVSIYGKDTISKELPLKATLANGIWHIEGSAPKGDRVVGGFAEIDIAQSDARVMRVTHGQ